MSTIDTDKKIDKIKNRKQTFNLKNGLLVDRNKMNGKFTGLQKDTLNKLSITLNKLARYDKGE